ncbi:MAG: hypothetical protein WDN26_04525 [Chitinophagaceae bacterium]
MNNPVNCKKGFKPLEDYEEALAKARKENKPLLIDFHRLGLCELPQDGRKYMD